MIHERDSDSWELGHDVAAAAAITTTTYVLVLLPVRF